MDQQHFSIFPHRLENSARQAARQNHNSLFKAFVDGMVTIRKQLRAIREIKFTCMGKENGLKKYGEK